MKTANKFTIALCGALLVFLLVGLGVMLFYEPEDPVRLTHNMLIALLSALTFGSASVTVYASRLVFSRNRASGQDVAKIILLSDSNVPKEEFYLTNRTSALIGKSDVVYIRSEIDLASDGYAAINCVDNCWYVERVFEERSVGLKRAGEQFAYKLKTGMSYRLHKNDIIYIGNERLLVV